MKKCFTMIMLMGSFCAKTQVLHTFLSEAYNSPAAYSKNSTDAMSFLINQAALAEVKKGSAAFYTEKKYGVKELTGGSAALAFRGAGGGLGIALGVVGAGAYNRSQVGLAYGRALGTSVNLGVQISYHLVHTAGYGNTSATGFELGSVIRATDKLFAGIHICNPIGGKFGPDPGDRLPAIYTVAFDYEASDNLFLCMQTKKTENQPVDMLFALHYRFAPQFFVRAGMATSSGNSFAGFSLQVNMCRIDLIGNYHPQLGATPALQFIVQFQKSEQ